ncbi:hypothetical protein [Paramicrobacterium chengjingii]|uniref:DUF3592 domain-containing protein n=1 Tax=Paramicrobacterium chengjingii TaxID=2769067 RepID=A0ABX6YK52_9MICO|nr:hypothetical protein [Microbacterium chengjingii]QPZ39204.1 hypothetical protein HCR76_03820 [Microbacterium chengjingii]
MDSDEQIMLALEFASWIAFGMCVLVAVAALVVRLTSVRWQHTLAYVIVDGERTLVRWFHDAGASAGEAELSHAQIAHLGDRLETELYYRVNRPGTIRFGRPRSHARALGFSALGFLVIGIAASIAQLFLMGV